MAGERRALERATRARAEAEELLDRRRSEHRLALARYRQIEREGDAVLARYDPEQARQVSEKATTTTPNIIKRFIDPSWRIPKNFD